MAKKINRKRFNKINKKKNNFKKVLYLLLAAVVIFGIFNIDRYQVRKVEDFLKLEHYVSDHMPKNYERPDEPYNQYIIYEENPSFTLHDLEYSGVYREFSPLDKLNRVGPANAIIGIESFPNKKRGEIRHIKPTGWKQKGYDFIEGGVLYNRCHLIAFMFSGENANINNLMTGTKSFNNFGMLPYEIIIYDYIVSTGNRVRYRVSPDFRDNELLARGVLMEAYSIEDNGAGIKFKVYVKNIEKGVSIDYLTGESIKSE